MKNRLTGILVCLLSMAVIFIVADKIVRSTANDYVYEKIETPSQLLEFYEVIDPSGRIDDPNTFFLEQAEIEEKSFIGDHLFNGPVKWCKDDCFKVRDYCESGSRCWEGRDGNKYSKRDLAEGEVVLALVPKIANDPIYWKNMLLTVLSPVKAGIYAVDEKLEKINKGMDISVETSSHSVNLIVSIFLAVFKYTLIPVLFGVGFVFLYIAMIEEQKSKEGWHTEGTFEKEQDSEEVFDYFEECRKVFKSNILWAVYIVLLLLYGSFFYIP